MKNMLSEVRAAVIAVLSLAVVLCGAYPLVVWLISQGLFPYAANGSLMQRDGVVVGSELIAQSFSSPGYFHPRPSAAGEAGYDGANSGGTNLGPLSKKLAESVKRRAEAYRAENGLSADRPVPADAVTASGSGLDPHISLGNAFLQAPRVAHHRGMDRQTMVELIQANTEGRGIGILGEPRVNVLKLNLALDRKK
ncbi:MAG: potassium-transporting ATPase subunit KdpC [Desulfobacterales bacterium]|jgi:K+-transporting ATPase ATPase C chain|nr:potassium-transporting ATPase subunit KdpC [Desulfobacterales bacterium]